MEGELSKHDLTTSVQAPTQKGYLDAQHRVAGDWML
jgi:hypothetical protein